jgi:hypothetical protein
MISESEKNTGISDFLIEVSEAVSFEILDHAYHQLSEDFKKIAQKDTKGLTTSFAKRYIILADQAKKILQEVNGNQPTIEERAVFGEMVALRDICFQRLKIKE